MADDAEPVGTGRDGADPPPEFVGSPYQRTTRSPLPGIFCPDWAIRLTATKAELLVLSQIAYWFAEAKNGRRRVSVHRKGRWWLYKTYASLAAETGGVLSIDQVRGAVRSLAGKGVVVTEYDPKEGRPVHFRINPDGVARLLGQAGPRRRRARAARRRGRNDEESPRS